MNQNKSQSPSPSQASAPPLVKQLIDRVFRGERKHPLKRFLESVFELECRIASSWASGAHVRLQLAQWGLPPRPRNFDHQIDLFHGWLATRNSVWLERGAFNALALKGGKVLELSCGDGFNTRNFYLLKSEQIVACDIDPAIIRVAKEKNPAQNITYQLADITQGLPPGRFANVIWDFGFPITEFFSPAQIEGIFSNVKAALTADGIFSGYTTAEDPDRHRTDAEPAERLRDRDDLRRMLRGHFRNVVAFETLSPGRKNLYFWASDSVVPFDPGWPQP